MTVTQNLSLCLLVKKKTVFTQKRSILTMAIVFALATAVFAQTSNEDKKIGKELNNEIHVDNAVLNTYKGKYAMSSKTSRIALIKELQGRLVIEVVNEWKAELSALTETIFNVKNVKPTATLECLSPLKSAQNFQMS